MIPDYPWFGPRHGMGWGWAPISWEGKVLSFVVIAALLIATLRYGRSRKTFYAVCGGVVVLLVAVAVTGTTPG